MTATIITFDARKHEYKINGVPAPGVTKICRIINKPGLATWRGAVGNAEADRISRESAEFGTRVHSFCEQIAQSPYHDAAFTVPGCPPDITPFAQAFRRWLDYNVKKVLGTEMRVASKLHHYAGTLDLLVEFFDGSIAVCDIKTSKQCDEAFGLQLSAYQKALLEMPTPYEATKRLVIHMPNDRPGVLKPVDFDDHEEDWRSFLAALILHRRFG